MKSKESLGRKILRYSLVFVFSIVLPLSILGVGIYGAMHLMDTAPKAERHSSMREERARSVQVIKLEAGPQQALIDVMGTVRPSREAALQPLVSGEIIETASNLEPGGVFRAGEELFRIDPLDYDIMIRRMEAQVARNKSYLALEEGQQQIAREEFKLLGEELNPEESTLILREPQMAEAKANLEAAESELEGAKLDRSRTSVKVPFDSLVVEEDVELGVVASSNSSLVRIVGIETFWVELAVPVDQLRWIEMPNLDGTGGSTVRLYDDAAWGEGRYREGRIIRYTPDLDQQSRMARMLVEVVDPLSLQEENAEEPPLLINSYVRAEVEGVTFPNAVAIERRYLREGTSVWVMNGEERLDIRELDILWSGRDVVYARDVVKDGEFLVTTNLSAPVPGMLLRSNNFGTPQENLEEEQEFISIEADASPSKEVGGSEG